MRMNLEQPTLFNIGIPRPVHDRQWYRDLSNVWSIAASMSGMHLESPEDVEAAKTGWLHSTDPAAA
jgi:hypothetical protein